MHASRRSPAQAKAFARFEASAAQGVFEHASGAFWQ